MNSATFESLYSAFSRPKGAAHLGGHPARAYDSGRCRRRQWLWAALKSTFSGAAMLLAMYLLGLVHGLRPLAVMPVVLLIGLAFAGLGLIWRPPWPRG